jgi:hypothetical protein
MFQSTWDHHQGIRIRSHRITLDWLLCIQLQILIHSTSGAANILNEGQHGTGEAMTQIQAKTLREKEKEIWSNVPCYGTASNGNGIYSPAAYLFLLNS